MSYYKIKIDQETASLKITTLSNNSTADYKAIMPIFRSEGDYVVIPQFDKNGLVMVMSILKSTDVNAVKALGATGKALNDLKAFKALKALKSHKKKFP